MTRGGSHLRPVPLELVSRDPLEAAPQLLNALVVRGARIARIVEVEAYRGAEDPASHAFRGPTQRNLTMFGPPGHLYVYFTYGMHWCANVVCGPEKAAGAVLLRAAAPVAGEPEMRRARPGARTERDLLSGPAKLCQALGITGALDGANLLSGESGIRLCIDDLEAPREAANGPRIGISVATDRPWRWWIPGNPHVSGPRRATRGRPRDVERSGS